MTQKEINILKLEWFIKGVQGDVGALLDSLDFPNITLRENRALKEFENTIASDPEPKKKRGRPKKMKRIYTKRSKFWNK